MDFLGVKECGISNDWDQKSGERTMKNVELVVEVFHSTVWYNVTVRTLAAVALYSTTSKLWDLA